MFGLDLHGPGAVDPMDAKQKNFFAKGEEEVLYPSLYEQRMRRLEVANQVAIAPNANAARGNERCVIKAMLVLRHQKTTADDGDLFDEHTICHRPIITCRLLWRGDKTFNAITDAFCIVHGASLLKPARRHVATYRQT